VHPVHLSRSFRRHFGLTLTEYVRQGRLARAMVRLSTTDDPMIEIARDVGFADQSHFTREFRRAVGDSPGGYRSRLRGRRGGGSADRGA
jgi:AraC family transcriptional regulator